MKDKRSKKLVVLSHCLLNQNSKVPGIATYAGMVMPLIELLGRYEVGIIQLPCPEASELGIGRPMGDDTKQMYDTPSYRKTCSDIAIETVNIIKEYQSNGYKVACILGVDGSPSCGINVSPTRKRSKVVLSKEPGIFFEILSGKMQKEGIDTPIIGISESEQIGSLQTSLEKVESILRK